MPFEVAKAGGMCVERPWTVAARDAVLAEFSPLAESPLGLFVLAFRDLADGSLCGVLLVHHDGDATAFHVCGTGPAMSDDLADAMRRVLAVNHPQLRVTPEVVRDLGIESGIEASCPRFYGGAVEHVGITAEEVEVLQLLGEPLPYLFAPDHFEEWLRSRP